MGSYPDEFPFGIMEVVELLHLRVRRQQANSVYVDCPFCGDRRGRMNVNFVKNVWRCNHCDEHGGMLALYAKLNHTTTSDAYWEIAEALCDNTHEEHARSGNEAQQQPVSTGSPSSGARAAAAGHSSSERKTVPQSDKASPAEIHQTLSLLLAQQNGPQGRAPPGSGQLSCIAMSQKSHARLQKGQTMAGNGKVLFLVLLQNGIGFLQ